MPVELAGIVLGRLLRHVDRVRFAAVCQQWRSSALRNHLLPSNYPWLALPDRTFYSLPDSAFRPLPLHLDRHRQLPHAQSSCGEWLMFERYDGSYTLVSPFSVATTILLPGLSSSYALDKPLRVVSDVPVPSLLKIVVCSADLVAAVFDEDKWTTKLALCRPGASSWHKRAHGELRYFDDMVWFQGKLYVLDSSSGLFSVSIGTDRCTGEPTVSGLEHLIERPRVVARDSPQYLVESGGALLLVQRVNPNTKEEVVVWSDGGHDVWRAPLTGIELEMETTFEVSEADLAGSRWRMVRSVGEDRVLFIGPWCSRSVVVRVEGQCEEEDVSCMGDRIFFVEHVGAAGYDDRYYRKSGPFYCSIYDMTTQWSELFLETSVQPLKGFPVTWLFPPS